MENWGIFKRKTHWNANFSWERSGACINTWVGKEKGLHLEFQSSEKRVTKIPKHYCKWEHNFYDTQLIYEFKQLLADNYFKVLESQLYIDLINNKYPLLGSRIDFKQYSHLNKA